MSKSISLAALPFAFFASAACLIGCASEGGAPPTTDAEPLGGDVSEGGAPPAAAPEPPEGALQRQIDTHLAAYGGTQLSPYEIVWDGGAVVLAFPYPGEQQARPPSAAARQLPADEEAARDEGTGLSLADSQPAAGDKECDKHSYCFYEHADYKGKRLEFKKKYKDKVYFNGYGLKDKVSCWANNINKKIWVYDQKDNKEKWLWTEYPKSKSDYVGDENNDKADYFVIN
ncbi:MAG TPA: peptidase inhibitor family I36 protein [Polyangiaceae bacterium]|nr:peptidase inhibitor family I36 protein [Polyangiaceae bacterium]